MCYKHFKYAYFEEKQWKYVNSMVLIHLFFKWHLKVQIPSIPLIEKVDGISSQQI